MLLVECLLNESLYLDCASLFTHAGLYLSWLTLRGDRVIAWSVPTKSNSRNHQPQGVTAWIQHCIALIAHRHILFLNRIRKTKTKKKIKNPRRRPGGIWVPPGFFPSSLTSLQTMEFYMLWTRIVNSQKHWCYLLSVIGKCAQFNIKLLYFKTVGINKKRLE